MKTKAKTQAVTSRTGQWKAHIWLYIMIIPGVLYMLIVSDFMSCH